MVMNIEEERKAFEKLSYPNAAALDFAEGVYRPFPQNQSIWSQKVSDHANKLFPIWLAAKAHAAEMAKPVANIRKRKDHHQWAVYIPTSLTAAAYDFPDKEDAIAWAAKNGYRVAPE